MLRRVLAVAAVCLAMSWTGIGPAFAQDTGAGDDLITSTDPIGDEETGARQGREVKVYVFGDSLADGVWSGLRQAFRGDKSVSITKVVRPSSGFVRVDYFDWAEEIDAILENEKMDIAFVLMGAYDRQRMRKSDGRHRFGTDEFLKIYNDRVDRFMKAFVKRRIKLYWLGLPIVRGPKYRAALTLLNDVVKENAEANGVTFIPTWDVFDKGAGQWTSYGEDITGRRRRLRANDGLHFTPAGYRKFAAIAEQPIREFLASGPVFEGESVIAAPGANEGEQTPGLIDPTGTGASTEFVLGPGGTDGVSVGDGAGEPDSRTGTLSPESPAYKVLVLGDTLEAKPGRGDDFRWNAD